MKLIFAVKNAYQAYFGTGGYGVMFVVAVIWLVRGRYYEDKIKRLLGPAAILAIIAACPLTAKLFMIVAGEDVYWRIFWLFPVYFVLAAAGAQLISGSSSGWKKAAAGAFCVGLIALNGPFVLGDSFFTARENNFKLPTPVIRVADAINAHAQEYHIKNKKTVSPAEIAVYIRIYDPTIRQRYGRYSLMHEAESLPLTDEINKNAPDLEKIDKLVKKSKLRYVTLKEQADDREKMEALGYECIYDDTGYAVYFRTACYKKKKQAGT